MKEVLKLKKIRVYGLKNVLKHTLLKCIAILIIALTAIRMGKPELIRCTRYFQN
jgi:hypothetical protein